MEQFFYQYLLDQGFERQDLYDSFFEKRHGYKWFVLQKKLARNFILSWQPDTMLVELLVVKKGIVKHRANVETAEQLEFLCKLIKAE
jgi:hypothetical protein